ncbi:ankyrin repeat domain-containing protein [Streptomyces antarcticus]|uniref:ankyrin repeat domain-containing protein n=1 Tax=Streptomyces antarcticus TaxID=2996458 RepID=UPI002272203C|nr:MULTISPECIES: ankyrin repeat domain-containing protein [unclassified Streptomyces]MCY0947310.1 ankyrin repeat domain-containing protein [Streptomyces sp. H34-AA3]MCZ4084682.1 ankyrin repeat domain-containing protein [Streptomyces sp. H34-S5]
MQPQPLESGDPLAISVTAAIRSGDLPALRRLLDAHPALATARIVRRGEAAGERSLLHVATDWPGHRPRTAEVIRTLVAAGADPGARFVGAHAETPLHWAASNDDVHAVDALVAAGADIEAPGAVLGGGTPLTDACGFGQWRAARRLLDHGARPGLQEAAALGLLDRVVDLLACGTSREDVTSGFWAACHGGQLSTARYLLSQGADLNWIGHDRMTPLDIALTREDAELIAWLKASGGQLADGFPPG